MGKYAVYIEYIMGVVSAINGCIVTGAYKEDSSSHNAPCHCGQGRNPL